MVVVGEAAEFQRHVRQDAGRMIFNQSELGRCKIGHGMTMQVCIVRSPLFLSLFYPPFALSRLVPLDAHLDGLHASAVSGSGIRVWGL